MRIPEVLRLILLIENRETSAEQLTAVLFGKRAALLADSDRIIEYKIQSDPGARPQYSIIVPTLERREGLIVTLESLLSQNVDPGLYEIIIVDDGSKNVPQTFYENLARGQKTPCTFIKLNINIGPAAARNIGLAQARGHLIFFTDDDCVIPPDWISHYEKTFAANPEITGAGGWYQTGENKDETIFDRFYYWQFIPAVLTRSEAKRNLCGNTANVCYRKDALLKLGGFNPDYVYPAMDDWELKIRLEKKGYRLLYEPFPVRHTKKLTFRKFIRHYMLRGWANFLTYKLYGDYEPTYSISLKHEAVWFWREWKKITRSENLTLAEKILFPFLSLITKIAQLAGKYLIPVEYFTRNQNNMRGDKVPD